MTCRCFLTYAASLTSKPLIFTGTKPGQRHGNHFNQLLLYLGLYRYIRYNATVVLKIGVILFYCFRYLRHQQIQSTESRHEKKDKEEKDKEEKDKEEQLVDVKTITSTESAPIHRTWRQNLVVKTVEKDYPQNLNMPGKSESRAKNSLTNLEKINANQGKPSLHLGVVEALNVDTVELSMKRSNRNCNLSSFKL